MRKLIAMTFGLLLTASGFAFAQGVVLQLPAEDQSRITSMLGPGVVGNALPSNTITDASIYFPLKERAVTYQVTSGPRAGNSESSEFAKVRRPGGRMAWRFNLSRSLTGFISQAMDGGIIMPAVSDPGEGVIVVTTPANPFVLQGMKPGESRSFSQQVAVNYLDNPSQQDYSGSLTGTYTYLGTFQVTVPAGTFPAVLFRAKSQGKVGPANTVDTTYTFFAPQVGLVAMIMQEDVTAFWLFHIDSSTGRVLKSK
ncbi:MAG TPA: hypothetical protein VMT61_15750 [Candidatus Binataceae bacterium]|nr:hypothetical protein [Candidatus Binataceae bacterium]